MKIIEAMKQIKDLQRKADDIVGKISKHCVLSSVETPLYENQKEQVKEWLQAHGDLLKEILRLRVAVQRTNLATSVTIELGGKQVTKSVAEWIHRRRDLAALQLASYKALSDRGIKEGVTQGPTGQQIEIKIIRFYDPKERDDAMELYASEPSLVDARMEIVNAVTDIIE